MIHQPECPKCGSVNVMLITDLYDMHFYLDACGHIEFDLSSMKEQLDDCLEVQDVRCNCMDCGYHWEMGE